MPEPDKEAHQAKIAEINEKIDEKKARMAAIREKIEVLSAKRKAGQAKATGPRGKLQKIRAERNAKIEEKKAIREQMGSMKRVDLPGKRDRPKMSVDSVDERIKKLEMKQSTGTMSLKEEKELMQEIKELKKSRAGIADYDSSLETLRAKRETQDMKRSELISILKELDTEIDALTEQRDAAQAEVEALGPQKDEFPTLLKERDELRPEITALFDEMRSLRDEYKKANDIWWESEKVWRDFERAKRQVQYEEQRKRKLVDDELFRQQREAEELAMEPQDPFQEDRIFCENLVEYLTGLAGAEEKAVEAAKEIDHGGMVAMGKKAIDDDAESWGGLAKGKNKKKKKKGGKATPKVMQHPVAKIGAFHEIGLEPPSSADQIPGLLDTLNAKIAEYVEKAKTYKPKTKVASKPRKVALRIQPRGESDLKVIIDVIPGN